MKPFTRITSAFLTLVCVAHAVRFAMSWEVTVNGVIVPVWLSIAGCIVTATFAIMLWRESCARS